ncbi:unnamed protein product [Notodromas monacha]|uniref:FERM domain-containing protein n=1 Tax=Notodromas monacha TaxID=399045 RepID=A0A7R9BJB2_9CRUS|nr:unnamed protein product [Notodromas monacha]CAG0915156.1 unnamed protein product [Notodromas monacha]
MKKPPNVDGGEEPFNDGDERSSASAKKTRGKKVLARVKLLDGKTQSYSVKKRCTGEDLLSVVADSLNLMEKDYFGLSFRNAHGSRSWLNFGERISKQMRGKPWEFALGIKFYPPDPENLHEDLTRYLLCLQVYDDLQSGKGLAPSEADGKFLQVAKKLAMYGIHFHPAKDVQNADVILGISAHGLQVFQNRLRIKRFAWPNILKVSSHRNKVFVKIRPGALEMYQSTVEYEFPDSESAKNFWTTCVLCLYNS